MTTVVMDWSRFSIFEWFVCGLNPKSPSFGAANVRCTDGRSIDFHDKLGWWLQWVINLQNQLQWLL